jgi:hypothetical protein
MAKRRTKSQPSSSETDAILEKLNGIDEMMRRHLGALGAEVYDPRQFLETGPRVVAQDASRIAVVVPITRDRLEEWRPFLGALLSL